MSFVSKTEQELLPNGGGRTTFLTSFQLVVVLNNILSEVNLQDGGFNENGLVYDLNDGGLDENHISEQPQHDGGLNTDNN